MNFKAPSVFWLALLLLVVLGVVVLWVEHVSVHVH